MNDRSVINCFSQRIDYSEEGGCGVMDFGQEVTIRKVKDEDIPAMVRLFTSQYRHHVMENPILPHRYLDLAVNEEMIRWLFENYDGVVALVDEEVVGYMGGIIVPHFKGTGTGIYTPEWGHCVDSRYIPHLYDFLLYHLDQYWRDIPYYRHGISFLGEQNHVMKHFFMSGYGLSVVDGLVPTSEAQYTSGKYEIRMANVYDWNALIALVQDYGDMARSYPLYLNLHPEQLVEELEEDLQDPLTTLWVAERNRKIVGILKTTEACKESCTIVRDRKTLGIGLLVVHPSLRRMGIGTDLLKHIIRWANQRGFERVTYAIETANVAGRNFFFKYFSPVCFTLIRYFDDRVMENRRNS